MDIYWDDILWNEQQYGALETQGYLNPNQPRLHKVPDTPSDDEIKTRLCMMRLPLMKTLLYHCMTSTSNNCARMETFSSACYSTCISIVHSSTCNCA